MGGGGRELCIACVEEVEDLSDDEWVALVLFADEDACLGEAFRQRFGWLKRVGFDR